MDGPDKSGMDKVLREIFGELGECLSWTWDERFETALAEFDASDRERIQGVLKRHLGIEWDKSNMKKAPDEIRDIAGNMGGLRPGQKLFTSDPGREVLIFCAWWPWGDGKTISIRMAQSPGGLPKSAMADLMKI